MSFSVSVDLFHLCVHADWSEMSFPPAEIERVLNCATCFRLAFGPLTTHRIYMPHAAMFDCSIESTVWHRLVAPVWQQGMNRRYWQLFSLNDPIGMGEARRWHSGVEDYTLHQCRETEGAVSLQETVTGTCLAARQNSPVLAVTFKMIPSE